MVSPLRQLVLLAALVGALADYHHVDCSTTAGNLTITLQDVLSPKGVKRFLKLVKDKFFDDQIIYNVQPGRLMQFGVAADPSVQQQWQDKTIKDEPKMADFKHGTVSFAAGITNQDKDSRSCHIFIALEPDGLSFGENPKSTHETPIGEVTEGFDALEAIQQNRKKTELGSLEQLKRYLEEHGNSKVKFRSWGKHVDRIKECKLRRPGRTQEL
eukprot:gnl/TRDRNA2_/TRDRNA2_90748_c0_seq1.p1 gnl/TRDRNA2_/TRDRNA2_90748_c0~~gnl/TRDRNA2_/TRDRNA2_90748_c0_seq1.p1  ORF type:complete len:213 (+),score=42.75 gnl/TRDRNA2_/TRDRNA2_90748_c0_seq1:135-773(+)